MDIIKIPDINNYHLEIINNELRLTLIRNYMSENDILAKNFNNLKINYCLIKNKDNDIIINNNTKMFNILIDLYRYIPASIILQNTTLNIKLTNEGGKGGYNWYSKINMSIQSKNTNDTLKEILNMVKINNFKIDIGIKLNSGEIVNYKN
jgi:hypothetical protein